MQKHEVLALEQVARRMLGRHRRVTIGRYVVEEELGRGGFGAVYAAHDPELHRRVAIKLVVPGRHRQDPRWEARLVREARSLARVRHPNVVEVFDVGVDRDQDGTAGVFVVMELLRGESIRAWMQREPRPSWDRVVAAFAAAGRGLQAAHEQGVVHRDFKPDNVMLVDDGVAKVIDFGLALEPGSGESTDPSAPRPTSSPGSYLTSAGVVMGTPLYMPPEQHDTKGPALGPAADQYALCASLYHALHGKPPFDATSIQDLCTAKRARAIDPPAKDSVVPRSLHRVILRGMDPDPARRWPSVTALVDALEHELAARRRPVRRRILAAGIAIAAFGAVGTAASEDAEPCRELAMHRDDVWTSERADAIRSQLLSDDASVGGDAWTRVDARLQSQLSRWTEQFDAACPAADEAIVRCLDGWLGEAEATLSVLEEADAARAIDLVAKLPDASACSGGTEASALAGIDDDTREDLARARAFASAARLEAASEIADGVLEQARKSGDPRLVAYAATTAGIVWAERQDFERARALLVEAADLAANEGIDVVAAEAATTLVRVHGAMGAFDDARRWAHVADARIAGLGDPPFMRRWLLNARAFALIYEGEYEEAYRLALALVELAPAEEVPLVRARALANVALTAFEIGRPHEARAVAADAIALLEAELGETHPSIGRILADAGGYACAVGDVEQGVAMLERGIAMMESNDPYALRARQNLADYLSRLGRDAEALAILESTHAATKQLYGANNTRTASTAFALADEYLRADRPDDALPLIREATTALTQLYGAGSPRLAWGSLLLARAHHQKGELDAARDVATRALEGLDLDDVSEREQTINLTLFLAGLAHEQGRLDEAVARAEHGIAVCKGAVSSNDPSVLAAFEGMRAVVEAERGHTEAAVEAAREGIAYLQRIGVDEGEELAELQAIVAAGAQRG
jgi:tetratricopeptide (TPR) repeat protein